MIDLTTDRRTNFDLTAFRAYDIRGRAGSDISPAMIAQVGRAFVDTFGPSPIVVGYDARPLSAAYATFFCRGARELGADIIWLGLAPNEVIIGTAGLKGIDHAAILTASHNPPEYVGLKLYKNGSEQIAEFNGQGLIRAKMNDYLRPTGRRGHVWTVSTWPGYLNFIGQKIGGRSRRRVLADAGNGTGGILIEHLKPVLNLDVEPMFFEPDGTFPHHVPNPVIAANRAEAEKRARGEPFDFTVLLDGDGDRIVFLDERGDLIPTDLIGTLIIERVIQKQTPGEGVVIDLRRGWTTIDSGRRFGYPVTVTKAGNPYLKQAMREHNATVGFETSGHTIYRDYFFSESVGLTLGYVLKILDESGQTLSQLVASYREKVYTIDEINFRHLNPTKALAAIEAAFTDRQISHTDGMSVEATNWHANIRPSNTEPLLRLNIEARSQRSLDGAVKKITEIIASTGGHKAD